MSKPSTEGHIHGIAVVIIKASAEERTRALREFVPLDAYELTKPPVHEYEIGALFQNGDIGKRVILRRMDRRAVFTDEQLVEMMGEEKAREYLRNERRRTPRRRGITRARGRGIPMPQYRPDTCQACGLNVPLVWDHRAWICSRCNTVLVMVSDSTEVLRKLAEYVERVRPNRLPPSVRI